MAGLYRDLIKYLKQHGCTFVRQGHKGSHEIWHSPKTGVNFSVPKTSKSKHMVNECCKQAGLPKLF